MQTADSRPGVKYNLCSVQRLNVLHKLGLIPTSLTCLVVVLLCFACLVFRAGINKQNSGGTYYSFSFQWPVDITSKF